MTEFEWVAAAIISVLSAARFTRLLTYDAFPPSAWVRAKYDDLTHGNDWGLLVHCGYCASFWITLAVMGSGWATGWHPAWWFTNAVFGGSYVAAIIMVHDGDD